MFASSLDPVLKEIGTEQLRQVLRSSLPVETNSGKDERLIQLFFKLFCEEHYPFTFPIGGQYLQSILRSISRRPSSLRRMTSSYTFKAFEFLQGVSLVNTVIFSKYLSCSGTYVKRTLAGYTLQKITKAWIALAYAAGMRPFSRMVSSYLIFNRT